MLFVGSFYATVALYGFFRYFNPDANYFSNILTGPSKNFTVEEITQDIYSLATYFNLLMTLVAMLVTDLLQYKPVIVLGTLSGVLTKFIQYFGYTTLHMQVMEVFYSMMKTSALAYRTYIYTKVDKSSYQLGTAIVNIMPKAGQFLSSIVAQVLLSFQLASLDNLVELSMIAITLALLVALTLPPVEKAELDCIPEKQESPVQDSCNRQQPPKKPSAVWQQRYRQNGALLWQDFKDAYSDPYVIKWSIWWVVSLGATQLGLDYYIQALWSETSGLEHNKYNAGVDAVYTLLSSGSCYLIGLWEVDWHRHGDMALALCTIIKGVSMVCSAYTDSLTWSYALYIFYSTLFDAMTVISNSEVALQLKSESFGLIFGVNMFLSLVFQSLLTFILTSKHALALPIRDQFVSVGWCFNALGLFFLIKAICRMFTSTKVLEIQDPSVVTVTSDPVK